MDLVALVGGRHELDLENDDLLLDQFLIYCRGNGDRVPKCEWNERGSKEDQSNALDTVQREEGVEKTEEKNGRCQNTSLSQSGVPSAHRTARGSFSSERSTATRVRLALNCEQETAVTHRNFLFPYFSYKVTPTE